MREPINYVNLSNGIEALQSLQGAQVRFMRLQSTDCEHKSWAKVLDGLPDGFLMDVAMGVDVVVHDRSCSRRAGGLSRAQWQGLEWVRYAMSRAGWGLPVEVAVPPPSTWNADRPIVCVYSGYWRRCWASLPASTIGRLQWFGRFVQTDVIRIRCAGGLAEHDGDREWQCEQLRRSRISSKGRR